MPSERPTEKPTETPTETADRRDPIWVREARREPRARALTRERVVAAAIEIADREGLEAVSIRRLAAALAARPMSLYDHFETKDDLHGLMYDAVVEEALVDDDAIPDDWRAALRLLARHSRRAALRHPWLVSALGRDSRLGPATLRHIDQSVAAVRTLDADEPTRQALVRAVDTFMLGHVIAELAGQISPPDDPRGAARRQAVADYVHGRIAAGGLPHLTQLDLSGLLHPDDPDAAFERGLDWLLAGAAAMLEPR